MIFFVLLWVIGLWLRFIVGSFEKCFGGKEYIFVEVDGGLMSLDYGLLGC